MSLIWHPAQAAPDRETSVFDQALAGDAPAPSESIIAYGEATPACGDAALIGLWLDGRPPATRRAYEADAAALLACLGGVPLRQARLADLQAFAASLARLAPASRARRLAAAKSLFTFGHRTGLLPTDVARPLHLPKVKNVLAERILEEAEVGRLIALEPSRRNHALLRLLYLAGLRLSEAAALSWCDLRKRGGAGQVTVFGKGGKTRAVLLPASLWRELAVLRGDSPDEATAFRSREGPAPAAGSARRRCTAWSRLPPAAPGSAGPSQRIGCGTALSRCPLWSGRNSRAKLAGCRPSPPPTPATASQPR